MVGPHAVVGAILWLKGHGSVATGAAVTSALLFAGGTLAPTALGPLFQGWMRFGLVLSRITTPIVLGILYFLVITPTGLVMRLLGRRPLLHRPTADGYWKPHAPAAART